MCGQRWDPSACFVCGQALEEGGECTKCKKTRDPSRCPKCGSEGGPTPSIEERHPAEEDDEVSTLPAHLMPYYQAYGALRKEPETGEPDLWGSGRGLLDELGVDDPVLRQRALGYWQRIAAAKGMVRAEQQEAREIAREKGKSKS